MKKLLVLFICIVMLLSICACSSDEANESKTEEKKESLMIEFVWDEEMIGDNYDIEFITDDDGSGYTIDRGEGKAVVIVESADINFDLTYVWLPPAGVLNNIPECKAKIYENGELKEVFSSNDTDNIFQAPTGAAGFGICSVKDGKLMEYSGEWTVFKHKKTTHCPLSLTCGHPKLGALFG